jgi:hypothetical protein
MNDGEYRARRLPVTRRQVRAATVRHFRRHADATVIIGASVKDMPQR